MFESQKLEDTSILRFGLKYAVATLMSNTEASIKKDRHPPIGDRMEGMKFVFLDQRFEIRNSERQEVLEVLSVSLIIFHHFAFFSFHSDFT